METRLETHWRRVGRMQVETAEYDYVVVGGGAVVAARLSEDPGNRVLLLRIALEDEAAGWTLAAVAKNILKKVYYVGGVGLGELFHFNTAVPRDPRTIQINARFKF